MEGAHFLSLREKHHRFTLEKCKETRKPVRRSRGWMQQGSAHGLLTAEGIETSQELIMVYGNSLCPRTDVVRNMVTKGNSARHFCALGHKADPSFLWKGHTSQHILVVRSF
jgi:hypothetical protein